MKFSHVAVTALEMVLVASALIATRRAFGQNQIHDPTAGIVSSRL
jgi:hypothetical protein